MAFKTNALSTGFIVAAAGMMLTLWGMNVEDFTVKVTLQSAGFVLAIIGAVILIKNNKKK